MQHRDDHPVRYRVTGRRNNITVVVRELGSLDEANALARRIVQVPGTDVDITEIPDPTETDLATFSRELSESIGWREHSKTS